MLNLLRFFNKICITSYNILIKPLICFSIFYSVILHAYGNTEKLTLEEYIKNPVGNVLFLRHALAPGFDAKGKPEKFNIEDCSTQRNLNSKGREQAKKIGMTFAEKGIKFVKIYSSQWCRCLETAELLKLGEVIEESSLNSGFKGIYNKDISLLKLKTILKKINDEKGIFLMVTHYGTITAMTGMFVDSGGVVAYDVKNKVSIGISLD